MTSRYEGLSIIVIKALSLRIPVVSFNINGVIDLTKKYESVFGAVPFETDSFIKKLKDCESYKKNNENKIKRESELIRRDFSNQKMLEKIHEFYFKFLKK